MLKDYNHISDRYEVISQEYIEELKSQAGLLRHKRTGARIVVLSNDDDNKVFNIGFKTPPKDSTGVAHIMEHSVLCGSKHFPAKDPFVELCKGSLNTFLNAMTYPDKTMYPIASCNDVDFQNLMHVYLDAVFYPNIYIHDEIFRQEGWHYELTDIDGELQYNGVVYNEMKGAFSSPEQVLYRKITDTLFPDTIYHTESGGDPDVIPELSYEQFLDFHHQYYHPSNSYIYLYGNMDVNEKLTFIDEMYLSHFDAIEVLAEIPVQPAFEALRYFEADYPVGQEDDISQASYMAFNWVIGNSLDAKLMTAFQILEYALMETPGAPLKKVLLEKEFGEDIFGSYETSIAQPYLSIIIKNMDASKRDEIIQVLQDELNRLVSEGLNKKTLEGALNYFEFKSREGDFGRWPKGLMYGLQLYDSWLYDDKQPFVLLKYQHVYDELRQLLDKDYFEGLIQQYLIHNHHASVLLLNPKKGLATEKEELLKEKLAAYKATLSDEEIEKIMKDTVALKQYQSEPTPKEIIEKIPLLSINDIKKTAEPLVNELVKEQDFDILHHDLESNDIDYVTLLFNVEEIKKEDVPYLGILSEALGNLDCDQYSYQELTDEVNLNTGGVSTNLEIYSTDADQYHPYFEVKGKALKERLPKLLDLMQQMMLYTHFEDDKRLKEILNQLKSRIEMTLMSSGHSAAMMRATAYFSSTAWYRELTEGIAFYQFLCQILKDYDQQKFNLIKKLDELCRHIFRKDNILIDLTANQECLIEARPYFMKFVSELNTKKSDAAVIIEKVGTCPTINEAFITSGMVQYNACAGNFVKEGLAFNGSMLVLKNILGNEYLWNNVRVKGGAYGCMCGFGVSGNGYFTSYRDPKLSETFQIYEGAAEFISHLEMDERELTKYMIGAIGGVDLPLTVSAKGSRSKTAYLNQRSFKDIQKTRDELLQTNVDTLKALAKQVDAVVKAGYHCVIGSESSILAQKSLFEHVNKLIQ